MTDDGKPPTSRDPTVPLSLATKEEGDMAGEAAVDTVAVMEDAGDTVVVGMADAVATEEEEEGMVAVVDMVEDAVGMAEEDMVGMVAEEGMAVEEEEGTIRAEEEGVTTIRAVDIDVIMHSLGLSLSLCWREEGMAGIWCISP